MSAIETIAEAAANLALNLIEREISEYDARKLAADRAAEILRQKLLLRRDAQDMLNKRRSGGK